ncbi:MAG TPA: tetratricopeptide repeat protein, partial [Alphaproteobacteria bacterium]|nr:tetratricopeptide repeat protein [Alphaproteobacteria bacterium]
VVDRWVAREPESWVAATARGYHFKSLAWASRGRGFIDQTTEEGRRGMYEAVRVGVGELERALVLEPSAVAPHPMILDMAMMVAPRSVRTAVYERAAAAHPLSFQVHVKHMHDLTPKWGGSYEAMERFAASLAPAVPHNPELGVLAAYPVRERAEAAWRRKDRAEALRLYDRAFETGTRASWLLAAARLAYGLDRHERMLAYLDLHEERWGTSPDQLYWKTRAYFHLDRVEEALRSAERGIALDPGDPRAYRQYAWALTRLERWPEAASAYEQALQFDPGNRWLLQQLAWITGVELDRLDEAKALYRAALAEHPDDPELVYGLGDLLADTGDPGAEAYLRRYLGMIDGDTDEERRRIEWIERYLQGGPSLPADHRDS